MLKEINSLQNPAVKQIVKLRQAKTRKQGALTIIEGEREVCAAVSSGIKLNEIFVSQDFREIADKFVSEEVYVCSSDVFKKISYGQKSKGILATAEMTQSNLNSINFDQKKPLLVLVIESVEKPGNFGAILRTCDAVGVDAVINCNQKTDLYNPNIIRSSLGAVFTNNVVTASNQDTYDHLKKNKVSILSADPYAKTNYTEVDMTHSIAIVVGNEQEGLSEFWKNNADKTISLNMQGHVDSLNVSTTAGILLYEARRQRK